MDLFLCLQFPRSDAKSHSQTHIQSHLNLALRGLEATQHQVHDLVTVVKDQSQQIERQSQQIERQSQQIERTISKEKEQSDQMERQSQQIERQSQQIERQSQQIERQSGQIGRLMSKDKEQLEKMERLMSTVEDQSQQIERLISKDKKQSGKMERSISTVRSHPPQREGRVPIKQILPTPFEWKLHSILLKHVSKPFYLFEGGYKYLLKSTPVSTGLSCKVCVYIKVVPGEFDELLSWPCKEKVRVACVKQDVPFGEFKSDVIDFEKGREPCHRPLNDDYHEYRFVLHMEASAGPYILIRVNRE